MEKNYIISESELRDLLTNTYKLMALESGGVDNWEWYGESIHDFLNRFADENNLSAEDRENLDFSIIIERDLESYVEVK